jgi:Caspase domain
MCKFKKIVLCILCIMLLTSTVYGKKKKIDTSDRLIVSFSKEGFGDVIAPSFFGSTSRQGEDKDIFWDEFDEIIKNISKKYGLIHTNDQENYDLIIKPEFIINIKKQRKTYKYSFSITLNIYNSFKKKLFSINHHVEQDFPMHLDSYKGENFWIYCDLSQDSIVKRVLGIETQNDQKSLITLIEKEFISHPQFVLAYYWKKEFPILSLNNIDQKFIIWNGYSCENNKANILNPFLKIRDNVQSQIDDYLIPRNPIEINSQIPNIVGKPELPDLPKLVKGQFETKAMFDERVRTAMNERLIHINELQEKYRANVEDRNRIIEKLTNEYEEDIEKIRNEQITKKEEISSKINEFSRRAFFEVMGVPILENPIYDAETEIMYVDLKASNAKYHKKLSLNVPLSNAETFFDNVKAEHAMPIVIYSIENNSINLNQIKVYSDKEYYFATLTDEDFKPETIEVVLKDKKIEFDSEKQMNLELQNPNLIDTYRVNAIQYGESSDAKGLTYNDDITPIVEKLESKTGDSKKWLFIIAVENYDETDPVTFSKNSAELFKVTAQKVFGIKERNTYALIENDATSGKIKDKLQRLYDNVKEGDIIYFYYSGHGVPVPKTEESFILPKDKIVDYISKESEFNLSNIYKKLSVSKAEKVFAFIDACFSGKTDNIPLFKGVAPGLIKTKKIKFNKDKMVVITAGKDNQFSNSFDEKGHRMFSYYLIKSLATRKDIDIDLLYKDISVKVHDTSFEKGDVYIQEPQIYGNKNLNLYNEEK